MIQISLYICACQMSIMNTPLNYLLSIVFDAESCNRDCLQVIVFLLLISLALLDHWCAKCVLGLSPSVTVVVTSMFYSAV